MISIVDSNRPKWRRIAKVLPNNKDRYPTLLKVLQAFCGWTVTILYLTTSIYSTTVHIMAFIQLAMPFDRPTHCDTNGLFLDRFK